MSSMNSLSLFLGTAVFLSVYTICNSQGGTVHNRSCQDSVMKLTCLNKSYIISIVSVFYGRKLPGRMICRSAASSYLSDETVCVSSVQQQVKALCEEKSSCNFTVDKGTLGTDPCPNVYKYIDVEFKCVDRMKFKRGEEVVGRASPTLSLVIASSTVRSTSSEAAVTTQTMTTKAIQSTSTLIPHVTRFSTVIHHQTETADVTTSPSSSARSSLRPHSVSVISSQPDTSVESLKTTKPASNTYRNNATISGEHGTMKLFRFFLSFHIVREEHIHKRTSSSVLWFMFGLLVGLFIMIAILVYYRVKQVRQERRDKKPNKAAYFKQKDCSDGTLDERVILYPKELEALDMESQLGETV